MEPLPTAEQRWQQEHEEVRMLARQIRNRIRRLYAVAVLPSVAVASLIIALFFPTAASQVHAREIIVFAAFALPLLLLGEFSVPYFLWVHRRRRS